MYKADSNFVWTDLSSYDTKKSRAFYEAVFGWQTHSLGQMGAEEGDRFGMDQVEYFVATAGMLASPRTGIFDMGPRELASGGWSPRAGIFDMGPRELASGGWSGSPRAGIFTMPPFFQKIGMPPFWMSYLAVDDIEAVVARARACEGAIIDVEPCPFGDGTMALIRDPLGAGFTCYEGPSIDAKGTSEGQMVWNELITSSIAAVEGFYREVVGLKVEEDKDFAGKRAKLLNGHGEEIAGIQEVPENIRTKKVYWLPFFGVSSLKDATTKIVAAGGEAISNPGADGTALFMDNTGAGFAIAEVGVSSWLSRLF